IQRFGLAVPPLCNDPLGFFSGYLRDALLGDNPGGYENDVYAIRSVIERLEGLKKEEGGLLRLSSVALLDPFRNAIRQSDHRQAIRLAADIPDCEPDWRPAPRG